MRSKQIYIEKKRGGTGTTIITIDGFLNEGNNTHKDWSKAINVKYPHNPWFHLHWKSENINKLINNTAITYLISSITPISLFTLPIGLFRYSGIIYSWRKALNNSKKAGEYLPEILKKLNTKKIILIGHSLGSRVIYHCLKNIKTNIVFEIHLLGGAVNNDKIRWELIENKIQNKIFNYYSSRDRVLQSAYKIGSLDNYPIGREKILTKKTSNIDVTNLVNGHAEFKKEFHKFIL